MKAGIRVSKRWAKGEDGRHRVNNLLRWQKLCFAFVCFDAIFSLAQEHGQPRKNKMTAGIVDNVNLTGVKAGLEFGERHV